MRKWIGIICVLLGVVCLLSSVGFVAYNRWENENAEDIAQDLLEDIQSIIEEKQPENETKDTTRFAFASTDETLKNLQKEWAEMQKPELTAPNNEAEKQNDE